MGVGIMPAYDRRGAPIPGPSSYPTGNGQVAAYNLVGGLPVFAGWVTPGDVVAAGKAGGQTIYGGTAGSDDLTLQSNSIFPSYITLNGGGDIGLASYTGTVILGNIGNPRIVVRTTNTLAMSQEASIQWSNTSQSYSSNLDTTLARRSSGGLLATNTLTTAPQLTLKATASQAVSRFVVQDSEGLDKFQVDPSHRLTWPNVAAGEFCGLQWDRAGSYGVDLVADPTTGSLLFRDSTSGAAVTRATFGRTGGLTVAGAVTMDGMGLGSAISGTAFAFNANVYTGGKTDAIRFGTFRSDGAANDVVRLAITTGAGAGDGVAEVAVRNAVLTLASLADADTPNGSLYYSTTASKLVYKDGSGVVNALY